MSVRGESATFAMFCTIEGWSPFLFAEVADEIEAVRTFNMHVDDHGRDHIPFIHMEPMRDEWRTATFKVRGKAFVGRDAIDPDRNLFRAPAEASA